MRATSTTLLVAAGLLALVVGAGVGWMRTVPATDTPLEAIWAAKFDDLGGKPFALADLKGRPLVLNFWATWCGPCKEEMPDFQRLAASDLGKSVKIVGIGIDNSANMQAFAQQMGISYTLLAGGPGGLDLLKTLGNSVGGLPFTLVIDAHGKVVLKKLGRVSADELQKAAATASSNRI